MSKRIPFLLGFLLLFFAVWLQVTRIEIIQHWIERFQNVAYDMQLRAHFFTQSKKPLQTEIAIVDIDDKSLDKEGRWPWSRAKLATLVDNLHAAGAVVIAFDMVFPNNEENVVNIIERKLKKENLSMPGLVSSLEKIAPLFDNDAKFAISLSRGDEVVGVSFLPSSEQVDAIPPPLLILDTQKQKLNLFTAKGVIGPIASIATAAKHTGFINVFPDEDGVIRRVPLLMEYNNGVYPSLAFEAVKIYLLSKVKLVTAHYGNEIRLEGIQMGSTIIPTDEAGQVIIPFRGKSFTFPYYSATDVLNHAVPSDAFTGKIVFVGTTAIGLGDLKSTSIQNVFPGIEINATIADGLLKNNFPLKPPWTVGAEVFFTILLGLIFIFSFPYFGPRLLSICIIVLPILLMVANNFLHTQTHLIINILVPVIFIMLLALLNMIYGYLFETRKREHLKEMFGHYVPEEHIDEMLKAPGSFALAGEDREMTVLFADIRNFTTISEPLSAAQLKELLNDFFTPMTEIIFKNHGTIDKYVGDLIMAFWGAPLKDKRHRAHALRAALQMQKEIQRLQSILKEQQWPEINMGIGLNSGMMSVGDMGSKFRQNYTVLGDAVNLASRVESLTKFYDVKIATTEYTRLHQEKFIFRLLDRVRVKGKKNGVELYEVICLKTELTADLNSEIELSDKAVNFYFKQEWKQAEEIFSLLAIKNPISKFYPLYLERIHQFKLNPPPADWDGVYTHAHK